MLVNCLRPVNVVWLNASQISRVGVVMKTDLPGSEM